ncbi:MarR family transcriptional regulator [Fulvimarina sp. 2208YS6-2-32]|uniref:MarR family transcriptional regulator n=1 Tax=Fulvimarina uroteuthidis TaxID=3098149 RepID=A0ABU5I3Z6_9HYPH|nr:MarR family transcriptional regulator [Fulvimarina sp. 2208YS6-2-32]MDY8110083.1 MarR family transcriptional regulator [Fulvimarina sp. 2208YS6-2-32]
MPGESNLDAAVISGLLEQLTRRMHSHGYSARLFPAQWVALRYLNAAPSDLRTAIDLARYQGLASGAVARTVRALITKGFVEKKGTIGRGRAERLELTDRGRALLKRDPLQMITRAVGSLEEERRSELTASLVLLVRALGGRVDETEAPTEGEDRPGAPVDTKPEAGLR